MSDTKIQWRQNFKEVPCADAATIREKLELPVWHSFDMRDLLNLSRNHSLDMFSSGPAVRARENDTYITNRPEIVEGYRKNGEKAVLFSTCQRSDELLNNVGFLGTV